MTEDWRNGGFGLYIHWPFCESKCPYCDFNSHVASKIEWKRWKRAYLSEIDRVATLSSDRTLESVYFGGGTPGLMRPELVSALLERVRARWVVADNAEITLETNPSSVEAGRLKAFRDGGVNRVSVGIQALDDDDLRRLGRLHDVRQALSAFESARGILDRVSFDLIYARQDQTLADWRRELKTALSLAADHLSLYQLTIEDGTVFGERHRRGLLHGLPQEDLSADMYQLTRELCETHGFHGYEISNHARKGAESRHNLIYWRYGDYAGIGPGAHGRLTLNGARYATESHRDPETWLNRVEACGDGTFRSKSLDGEAQGTEFLLMGLRLDEGVDPHRYRSLAGKPLDPQKLRDLSRLGLIDVSDTLIRATERGRTVLDSVLRELLGIARNV